MLRQYRLEEEGMVVEEEPSIVAIVTPELEYIDNKYVVTSLSPSLLLTSGDYTVTSTT